MSEPKEPGWHSRGFPRPDQNWFRMPNEFPNMVAKLAREQSLAEAVVLLYVLRHTWGYSEYDEPKHITMDEFLGGRKYKNGSRMDQGTGLSERAIRIALGRLVERGLLLVEKDERDRARIKKSYHIRIIGE